MIRSVQGPLVNRRNNFESIVEDAEEESERGSFMKSTHVRKNDSSNNSRRFS